MCAGREVCVRAPPGSTFSSLLHEATLPMPIAFKEWAVTVRALAEATGAATGKAA